jgi:hypothetical protein
MFELANTIVYAPNIPWGAYPFTWLNNGNVRAFGSTDKYGNHITNTVKTDGDTAQKLGVFYTKRFTNVTTVFDINSTIEEILNHEIVRNTTTPILEIGLSNYVRKYKSYGSNVVPIHKDVIFVFGANGEYRHGKGAALSAKLSYGAVNGQGGLVGNSYGLITKKDWRTERSSTLANIRDEFFKLVEVVLEHPELYFCVANNIGAVNAGWDIRDICSTISLYFPELPPNIYFSKNYATYLNTFRLGVITLTTDVDKLTQVINSLQS